MTVGGGGGGEKDKTLRGLRLGIRMGDSRKKEEPQK